MNKLYTSAEALSSVDLQVKYAVVAPNASATKIYRRHSPLLTARFVHHTSQRAHAPQTQSKIVPKSLPLKSPHPNRYMSVSITASAKKTANT